MSQYPHPQTSPLPQLPPSSLVVCSIGMHHFCKTYIWAPGVAILTDFASEVGGGDMAQLAVLKGVGVDLRCSPSKSWVDFG